MALAWRIYYDDGSTFSASDGAVELAPCDGVIIVAQADPDIGREILHIKDFYYWEPAEQRWYGCDRYGLEDYLRRPGWRKILAGRNTNWHNYSALFDRAVSEPGLPPKSARLVTEEPKAVAR